MPPWLPATIHPRRIAVCRDRPARGFSAGDPEAQRGHHPGQSDDAASAGSA